MAIERVEPLEKDIEVLIRQDFSPEARSAGLAEFARETLRDALAINTEALGRIPAHDTFVDGSRGADESTVKPDGFIIYEFDLIADLFRWIDDQLQRHSPVRSGRYKRSHVFFADGVEADPAKPPPSTEVGTFVNIVPYARRIEFGLSPQHPDGVYEVVTALASRRFGNIAKVQFTFRTAIGGGIVTGKAGNKSSTRNPAIIVTVK